jgi:hypothetical protein
MNMGILNKKYREYQSHIQRALVVNKVYCKLRSYNNETVKIYMIVIAQSAIRTVLKEECKKLYKNYQVERLHMKE